MEKKQVLIITSILLLIVLSLGSWLILNKRSTLPIVSPVSLSENGEKIKFLTWDDQAGFTFDYPENLTIDPHRQDMENYAHLEITSTKHPEGKIIILVNDADTETIDKWLKNYKEASLASVLDTSLAGSQAKKLLFDQPKKILTAAIDPYEGLFLLEATLGENNFWQEIYNGVIDSFVFKQLEEEEAEEDSDFEQTGGGGNIVYEEEEIIE